MISDFIKGFTSYFSAFGFIQKHKMYSYFILSGIISLILGGVIFAATYSFSGSISTYLVDLYPFDFGSEYIDTLLSYVSGGLILIIGFILFKYLLLIFISPFMGPLSAKVESIITQREKDNSFSVKQVSYEIIRGLRIALRNITKEIGITLILLILGLIPLLTIFVAPLIFLVQAYYAGFSNFDYFLERRTSVRESVQYMRNHRWQSMGNGSAFLLLLFIPIIGLFLAPVLGTIAATQTALKNRDFPEVI